MNGGDYNDKNVIFKVVVGSTISLMSACLTTLIAINYTSIPRSPHTNRDKHRGVYISSIIYGSESHCTDIIRMTPKAFLRLCDIMKKKDLLRPTLNVTVEEQLLIFLHIIGHNVRLRVIGSRFFRSVETVHRYFKKTLRAVITLHKDLVRPPQSSTPLEIRNNRRYWPWFKDCIGAIDGTIVRASVPITIQGRFRGRKNGLTQSVLAAVSFDMKFMYVLAGWEGSAHDSKILEDALSRPNGLQVPEGKYYLADAGYGLRNGFIPPYRGVRYHLKEYSDHSPENEKELFNLRHSSLRNTVERAFGVLKKRFRVLDAEPYWKYAIQVDVVLACCVLHNHIMGVDPNDRFLHETNQEFSARSQRSGRTQREEREENREWSMRRDVIANMMYVDYKTRE